MSNDKKQIVVKLTFQVLSKIVGWDNLNAVLERYNIPKGAKP